jgi:hypothetical protein
MDGGRAEELLVVPLALAGLAFLLDNAQTTALDGKRISVRRNSNRRPAPPVAKSNKLPLTRVARRRLATTEADVSLMLDRKLLHSKPLADVREVARTITLTTLRRLDGKRKAAVVIFLEEARLVYSRPSPFDNGEIPKGVVDMEAPTCVAWTSVARSW